MRKLLYLSIWTCLLAGLGAVGCQNPDASGTIQVNNTYNGGTCQFWVTLDNNSPVTIASGGSYNYNNVSPGDHTITYHTTGTSGSSGSCGFSTNGNTSVSCSVTVSGGVLYAANMTNGGNGAEINYTCP